jgi:hypothetical protein
MADQLVDRRRLGRSGARHSTTAGSL